MTVGSDVSGGVVSITTKFLTRYYRILLFNVCKVLGLKTF